jgi:squalene-hopene/tetraprenyl-beta-curcumene cyclase
MALSKWWVLTLVAMPLMAEDWNPQLAANYLDAQQKRWFEWKVASAHGGPCVSCHTGLTYLVARPMLRRALAETSPTSYEIGYRDGLRARLEPGTKTMFGDATKQPARAGVEAVIAAFALPEEPAFERMWSLQKEGTWPWFSLNLDPWETEKSPFYGATLAALAIGEAPAAYKQKPAVRERVAELATYLERERESQPLHNRLMLLWASAKLPSVLQAPARTKLIDEVWRAQSEDGGWTMDVLGPWKARDAAPASSGTNAYATAFTAFALQKGGVPASDPRLVRALGWLKAHQDRTTGGWNAVSMNKSYPAGSHQADFMRDAATSFAVLALLTAEQR